MTTTYPVAHALAELTVEWSEIARAADPNKTDRFWDWSLARSEISALNSKRSAGELVTVITRVDGSLVLLAGTVPASKRSLFEDEDSELSIETLRSILSAAGARGLRRVEDAQERRDRGLA